MLSNLIEMERITRENLVVTNAEFKLEEELPKLTLKKLLQRCSEPHSILFRHALRQALCMLTGYGIILAIPGPIHGQEYWLLLTTLLITKPNYSATQKRLKERISGTLIGIAIAILLVTIQLPESLKLMLITGSVFLFFWYFSQQYVISVAMITIFVALVLQTLGISSQLTLAIRAMTTLLGSALVYVALRYLWPSWLENHTHPIVQQLIKHLQAYQKLILQHYQSRAINDNEDDIYQMALFRAYTSEGELVRHWQALSSEPASKRNDVTMVYQLCGYFHTYLSHLSVLALHRGCPLSSQAEQIIGEMALHLDSSLIHLSQIIELPRCSDIPDLEQKIRHVDTKILERVPHLYGEELLIAFQLRKMKENLEKMQWQIISHRSRYL